MVPNCSYKLDRAEFAYYSKPFYETHLVLFYKKLKFETPPEINSVDDMKPYKIGGVLGFNYDHYGGKIKIDTGAQSREALVLKLHHDRVDFAILQKEVLLYLEKEGKVSLKDFGMIADPVLPIKTYYVLIIKNYRGAKIKKIIDEGLLRIKKDGTMDSIFEKYLGN